MLTLFKFSCRNLFLLTASAITNFSAADDTKVYSFIVSGDPQYHAEKSPAPSQLDPWSEEANRRFIEIVRSFPGTPIPVESGGGTVSRNLLGILVTGDLIDSADKNGGNYPAMQRFEWERFKTDYGLTGKDGGLPFPVYELHGNHDGPQGDTFVIDDIIERNRSRPNVVHVSDNGLHYSWDWGPLHLVSLGMFAGEGDAKRPDHHYAPRGSLEFLAEDLKQHVGESGRPIILSFHLHPNGPDFDWPAKDLANFHELISNYQIVAIFHGHTHGSPPSRLQWDGQRFESSLPGGIDIFNPDDSAAAKTDPRDPEKAVGLNHGFLYVELIDRPGVTEDEFLVRSIFSRDNWATRSWDKTWSKTVSIPPQPTR